VAYHWGLEFILTSMERSATSFLFHHSQSGLWSLEGTFAVLCANLLSSVALLVTFLGCFGAAKESRGMLGCYFFFLVLLVVTSVAIGYLAVSKVG
jgi:hypothetical protein